MYTDASFDLGIPDITNSTTRTASTNIFDAGSSKILFHPGRIPARVMWMTVITADASPTIQVDLVGSDDSDLDPNANGDLFVPLGSSGTVLVDEDATALASGDRIRGEFCTHGQKVAKRYYGLLEEFGYDAFEAGRN